MLLSFHSVFSTEFDLLHPGVIHTDSAKPQNVTLSQEIIPHFHFNFHFFSGLTAQFRHLSFVQDIGVRQTPVCCFWLLEISLKVHSDLYPFTVSPMQWQWSTDSAKCKKHALTSVLILVIWKKVSLFSLPQASVWFQQLPLYSYI